jgi:hypothetical protein
MWKSRVGHDLFTVATPYPTVRLGTVIRHHFLRRRCNNPLHFLSHWTSHPLLLDVSTQNHSNLGNQETNLSRRCNISFTEALGAAQCNGYVGSLLDNMTVKMGIMHGSYGMRSSSKDWCRFSSFVQDWELLLPFHLRTLQNLTARVIFVYSMIAIG